MVGAVTLYSGPCDGLDDDDLARVTRFTDQAAGAVALALLLAERENKARNLAVALESRSPIEQAVGILMVRAQTNATGVFEILRLRSQHTNVKLRDVATELVAEQSYRGQARPGYDNLISHPCSPRSTLTERAYDRFSDSRSRCGTTVWRGLGRTVARRGRSRSGWRRTRRVARHHRSPRPCGCAPAGQAANSAPPAASIRAAAPARYTGMLDPGWAHRSTPRVR